MMHFPPVSAFPPIFEFFLTFSKISKIFHFHDKISHFHPPKFLTTFFIDHKFRIFPLLCVPVLEHFPPDSRNFLISPSVSKISPCFLKIQQLFTYFTCIFPPTMTMMHLCITQCTYWTLLRLGYFNLLLVTLCYVRLP